MRKTDSRGTLVGAVGGAAAGYVLWLAAFSIAGDNAAVGQWAPAVLILSLLLGACAVLWALMLRRRRNYLWSGFGFGLPLLPVVLTVAVLVEAYL